jgi:hypothetical protein
LQQVESKSIIESIRDFILTCPFLENWKVNIDYLGVRMEYSIDPQPVSPILYSYVDGSAVKQYQFAFTSKEAYDGDARTGIENSGFYQQFEEWIEEENRKKNFPILNNPKQIPIKIETIQSGYLMDFESDLGQYQIQCRLIYEQEV